MTAPNTTALTVRIKKGANVSQDYRFYKWAGPNIIFDAEEYDADKYKLTADGYGKFGKVNSYGDGALYVLKTDCVEGKKTGEPKSANDADLARVCEVLGWEPKYELWRNELTVIYPDIRRDPALALEALEKLGRAVTIKFSPAAHYALRRTFAWSKVYYGDTLGAALFALILNELAGETT